jgi:hypothetical protein
MTDALRVTQTSTQSLCSLCLCGHPGASGRFASPSPPAQNSNNGSAIRNRRK